MAKVFIEETTLTAIGDAIRSKTGKSELIDPAEMHTEISSITTGGGEIPEEAFIITGDCKYRFSSNGWNWFISLYGDKIITKDVTDASYMFTYSNALEEVPFVINIKDVLNAQNLFNQLTALKVCPKVRGTFRKVTSGSGPNLENIIGTAQYLTDVEDLFEPEMLEYFKEFKPSASYYYVKPCGFYSCHSLRRVPSWYYMFEMNEESTYFPSGANSLYYQAFYYCKCLDEILNLPVWKCQAAQTSSMFSSSINSTCHLKDLTFKTNNGVPITTKWKSQTIDMSYLVGYGLTVSEAAGGGIPASKEVKDDATYQALKNDPEWFTTKIEYSRYNHDSAVNTINSLPDTSAYLASAGGTNTIKFKGASGSLTDGGAINTLTAEEIAIATAKGWTVTLS